MSRKLSKITSLFLCFTFLFQQSGFTQVAGQLNIAGYLTQLHSPLISEKFRPLHLRSLSYDTATNNFKLLLDKGDFEKAQGLSPHAKAQVIKGTVPERAALDKNLTQATKTLFGYFLIGITLPDSSFWVNLRPDSPDTIIDDYVAQTDVGKILLEADLQLKKDTAGFTSPQTPEGKQYWDKLYAKAGELLGNDNTTVPTLVRPWIVPGEIIIRETQDNAYIYKATLKVMLEQDYLKNSSTYNFTDPRLKALNEYSSQLMRELIIPKLTKEVNTSKRYAPLRQVYYSLILAQWFKQRFLGKEGLYSRLIDRKDLAGLTSEEGWSKLSYFQAYQKSFKEGEYDLRVQTGLTVRSYFSGGIMLAARNFPAQPGKPGETTSSPLGADSLIQCIQGRPDASLFNRNNLFAGITPQGISVADQPWAQAKPGVASPMAAEKMAASPVRGSSAAIQKVSSPAIKQSTRRDFMKSLAGGAMTAGVAGSANAKDASRQDAALTHIRTNLPDDLKEQTRLYTEARQKFEESRKKKEKKEVLSPLDRQRVAIGRPLWLTLKKRYFYAETSWGKSPIYLIPVKGLFMAAGRAVLRPADYAAVPSRNIIYVDAQMRDNPQVIAQIKSTAKNIDNKEKLLAYILPLGAVAAIFAGALILALKQMDIPAHYRARRLVNDIDSLIKGKQRAGDKIINIAILPDHDTLFTITAKAGYKIVIMKNGAHKIESAIKKHVYYEDLGRTAPSKDNIEYRLELVQNIVRDALEERRDNLIQLVARRELDPGQIALFSSLRQQMEGHLLPSGFRNFNNGFSGREALDVLSLGLIRMLSQGGAISTLEDFLIRAYYSEMRPYATVVLSYLSKNSRVVDSTAVQLLDWLKDWNGNKTLDLADSKVPLSVDDGVQIYQILKRSIAVHRARTRMEVEEKTLDELLPYLIDGFSRLWEEEKIPQVTAQEIVRKLIYKLASGNSESREKEVGILLGMLQASSPAEPAKRATREDLFINILLSTRKDLGRVGETLKIQNRIVASFRSPRAILVSVLNAIRMAPRGDRRDSISELFRSDDYHRHLLELGPEQKQQLAALQIPGFAELIEQIISFWTPPALTSTFNNRDVCANIVKTALHLSERNPEMKLFLLEVLGNSVYLQQELDAADIDVVSLADFIRSGLLENNPREDTRNGLLDLLCALAKQNSAVLNKIVEILDDEGVSNEFKIKLLSHSDILGSSIYAAVNRNSSLHGDFVAYLKTKPGIFFTRMVEIVTAFNPRLLPYLGKTQTMADSVNSRDQLSFLVGPLMNGTLNEEFRWLEGDVLKVIHGQPALASAFIEFLTVDQRYFNENMQTLLGVFNPALSDRTNEIEGITADSFTNNAFFITALMDGSINEAIIASNGDILKFTEVVFASSPVTTDFKINFINHLYISDRYQEYNTRTTNILLAALKKIRGDDKDAQQLRQAVSDKFNQLARYMKDLLLEQLSQAMNEDGFDGQGYAVIAKTLIALAKTDKEKAKFAAILAQRHSTLNRLTVLAPDARRELIPSDIEFIELVNQLANKAEALARLSAIELQNLDLLLKDRYKKWPKGGVSYVTVIVNLIEKKEISLTDAELERLTRYNQYFSHFSPLIYTRFKSCPAGKEEEFLKGVKSSVAGILDGRPYMEVKAALQASDSTIDDRFIFDLLMIVSPKFRAGVSDEQLLSNLQRGINADKQWRSHIENFIGTINRERAHAYPQISISGNRLVITHQLPLIQRGLAPGEQLEHDSSQQLLEALSKKRETEGAQEKPMLPAVLMPFNGESADDYVQRVKDAYCRWLGESAYVAERIKQIREALDQHQDVTAMGLLATLLADGFKDVLRDAINEADESIDAKFKKQFNKAFNELLDKLGILLGVPEDKSRGSIGDIAFEFSKAKNRLVGRAIRGAAKPLSELEAGVKDKVTADVYAAFVNMVTRYALAHSREDSERRWREIVANLEQNDNESALILGQIISSESAQFPVLEKPAIDDINTPNEKIAAQVKNLGDSGLREYLQTHALANTRQKAQERWQRIVATLAADNPDFAQRIQPLIARLDLPVIQSQQDEIFGRLHNLVFADTVHEINGNQAKLIDRVVGTEVLELELAKTAWQSVYGATADICIYHDMNLLDQPTFLLLALKANGQFVGYVNMHMVTKKDGKKVLLLAGINPSDQYLSGHSAREIFEAIIDSARSLTDISGIDILAISTNGAAISNRQPIASLVVHQNYDKDKLGFDHAVGSGYTSDEYFIVWERDAKPVSQDILDSISRQLPAELTGIVDVEELYRIDRTAVADIRNHLNNNQENIAYLQKIFEQMDARVGSVKAKIIVTNMASMLFKYGRPLSRVKVDLRAEGAGVIEVIHQDGIDIERLKQNDEETLLLAHAASPVTQTREHAASSPVTTELALNEAEINPRTLPLRELEDQERFLPVGQGEFDIVRARDHLSVITSIGADPCVLVVIDDRENGISLLAHMDGNNAVADESYSAFFDALAQEGTSLADVRIHLFGADNTLSRDTGQTIKSGIEKEMRRRGASFDVNGRIKEDFTGTQSRSIGIDANGGIPFTLTKPLAHTNAAFIRGMNRRSVYGNPVRRLKPSDRETQDSYIKQIPAYPPIGRPEAVTAVASSPAQEPTSASSPAQTVELKPGDNIYYPSAALDTFTTVAREGGSISGSLQIFEIFLEHVAEALAGNDSTEISHTVKRGSEVIAEILSLLDSSQLSREEIIRNVPKLLPLLGELEDLKMRLIFGGFGFYGAEVEYQNARYPLGGDFIKRLLAGQRSDTVVWVSFSASSPAETPDAISFERQPNNTFNYALYNNRMRIGALRMDVYQNTQTVVVSDVLIYPEYQGNDYGLKVIQAVARYAAQIRYTVEMVNFYNPYLAQIGLQIIDNPQVSSIDSPSTWFEATSNEGQALLNGPTLSSADPVSKKIVQSYQTHINLRGTPRPAYDSHVLATPPQEASSPSQTDNEKVGLQDASQNSLSIDSRTEKAGGIDFRALPVQTSHDSGAYGLFDPAHRAGPLKTSHDSGAYGLFDPAHRAGPLNLDESWQQIQNMIDAGIIPSSERLKEYLEACCSNENMNQEIDKVLSCIADILRLEEDSCQPTEAALKEMLVLIESDKPPKAMQAALINIVSSPQKAGHRPIL